MSLSAARAAAAVAAGAWAVGCGVGASTAERPKAAENGSSQDAAPDAPAASASEPSTTTSELPAAPGASTRLLPAVAPGPSDAGTASHKDGHTHETGRAPEDIRALVVAHRDEARGCYDAALATHPDLEGDLVIRWTIDPKGKVTEASADPSRSQITEPGVVACVCDVIKRLQFAPSPGGYETRASYPFNFHPRRTARPAAAP